MKIQWWKKCNDEPWPGDYLVCLQSPDGGFIKVLIPEDRLISPPDYNGRRLEEYGLNLVSGGHYE